MTTDYRCKVVILFYLSCFYAKIDSQVTETPDQSLVECSGNTINLRWNYITPNMITLQWFSGSLAMMSKVQTNAPTYRNNFNESVVEFVSDAEILLKALTTASTGSYSFKVSYLTGEDYSNATYLTVYDTFSSGLSCQYNGQDITCTKPDASVSLNATDGQGQGVELINPKASGNYTICMQGDAIVCRGAFPTCTTVEVIIQGTLSISYSGSNKLGSTNYILKCQIPGFITPATWSKNGKPMSGCLNTGCLTQFVEHYSFLHDNSAIYVVFGELKRSDHGETWTCEHGGFTTANFKVEVDSSEEGAIVCIVAICCVLSIQGIIAGSLVVFTRFIPISKADAKKWYFSYRHVCNGTVVYGIQIVIVGAVCQLSSILISAMLILLRYPGQLSDLVIILIVLLHIIYPFLCILVFRCFVAKGGKKEMLYKKFDKKYESCSLANKNGVRFTISDIGMISFKVKAEKNAHIAVFGKYSGVPLIDIILGYRDNLRSVVVEPNQLQSKDEYRGKVISSTEYNTFHLKFEQNHITLVNGKEEPILTWKNDKNTSLEIEDIVISNSLQEHAAMIKKSTLRFTKREIQVLCLEMNQRGNYFFDKPEKDTTFWNDVCSRINRLNDKDNQRTADEIKKMWYIIMSTNKGTLDDESVHQFDANTVLTSFPWIDTGTNYGGSGSPESGEWIIFVRQGDRLDERDEDARCFKIFLPVVVVGLPIAWLVLLIIGLWRWCKKDDSTSNRENEIHECEYSCLRGSFCNKTSHLDKQKESSDNPPPYTVKYNRSDVPNKRSKKSKSVSIEGRDIENRGSIENPSTGNVHDVMLDKNTTNRGNEKQVLTPITGVHPHIAGESKLNQKPFGTVVPLPPIDSPKEVKL